MKCECCETDLSFSWSDTHGVGCCSNCGLPYRIYHYDGDKRVEKPPEVAITPKGVGIAKRYWADKHRRVFPACFDMGFLGGRHSYSGATQDDVRAFNDWLAINEPTELEEEPEAEDGPLDLEDQLDVALDMAFPPSRAAK